MKKQFSSINFYANIFALIVSLTFLSTSCNNDLQSESEESEIPDSEKSILSINMHNEAEFSAISYPIEVFAFNTNGILTLKQTLTSSADALILKLPKGAYTIVAVCGNKNNEYNIPEKPILSSVITFNANNRASLSPLMMGIKKIELETFNNEIDIVMEPKVVPITAVLSDVPNDISSIKLRIGKVGNAITFNGEKSGSEEANHELTNDTPNSQWKLPVAYVFAGSEDSTKLILEMTPTKGDPLTYSYIYDKPLTTGKPLNFKGSYKGDLNVSGAISEGIWGDSVEIDFEFGEGSESPDKPSGPDNETTPPNNDNNEVDVFPVQGDAYRNSLVIAISNKTETSADLLLLAPKEWETLVSECDNLINEYSNSGISDWRLIIEEEAKSLKAYYRKISITSLNDKIQSLSNASIISFGAEDKYLCKSGSEKKYFHSDPSLNKESSYAIDNNSQTIFRLRAVKTVTVTKRLP